MWNRNDIRFVKIISLSVRIFTQDVEGVLNNHNLIILRICRAKCFPEIIWNFQSVILRKALDWTWMFNVNQINSRTELFVRIERCLVSLGCLFFLIIAYTTGPNICGCFIKTNSKIFWKSLRTHQWRSLVLGLRPPKICCSSSLATTIAFKPGDAFEVNKQNQETPLRSKAKKQTDPIIFSKDIAEFWPRSVRYFCFDYTGINSS